MPRKEEMSFSDRSKERQERLEAKSQARKEKRESGMAKRKTLETRFPRVYGRRPRDVSSYGGANEDIDSNKGEDEPVKFGQNSDGTNDGGGGGDSGGGDSDGFELITFDVVNDDNTTSQYQWRAEEV